MNKREWKPGDVAMVTWSSGERRIAVSDGRDWHTFGDDAFPWRRGVGGSDARPVVVIDPEDREQVERLATAYNAATVDNTIGTLPLREALREFANPTPPKPDEPTGLGAVVEDAEGVRWVREHRGWWIAATKPAQSTPHWSYIKAVAVLSGGVTT